MYAKPRSGRPLIGLSLFLAVVGLSACAGSPAMPGDPSLALTLPPLSEDERTELDRDHHKPAGEPMPVGIGRRLPHDEHRIPLADLSWVNSGEGRTALFSVRSPEASGLRLGFHLVQGPECRMQLQFAGIGDERTDAVEAEQLLAAKHTWWSPVTRGETARVWLHLPDDAEAGDCELHLPLVSHLF